MGANWFMLAFVRSVQPYRQRFGEPMMRLHDRAMVCCFGLKKSGNDWRICVLVIMTNSFRGEAIAL